MSLPKNHKLLEVTQTVVIRNEHCNSLVLYQLFAYLWSTMLEMLNTTVCVLESKKGKLHLNLMLSVLLLSFVK